MRPSKLPRRGLACLLVMVLMIATGIPASASTDIHPVEEIRQAVEQFLQKPLGSAATEDVTIEIGQLDGRLRLARCEEALQTRFPPGGRRDGNTAVRVSCDRPVTWSLYVPVTVERYVDVLVARRSLPRHHTLTPADLSFERIEVSRHAGTYHEEKASLVGLQTRRSIRPGQIVGTQHVTQPDVVSRGQRVIILAKTGTVAIRMRGEALENGTPGDYIRVKNSSSGRVVEGEIQPSGAVRVPL